MKSVDELALEFSRLRSPKETKAIISQIKLDALREGMRRAAEIADKTASENCMKVADESPWPHEAILSAAEQLTEKDL